MAAQASECMGLPWPEKQLVRDIDSFSYDILKFKPFGSWLVLPDSHCNAPKPSFSRSCANQAIGGNHYGPVTVYLSKVTDASTADGSAGWFKIFKTGGHRYVNFNPCVSLCTKSCIVQKSGGGVGTTIIGEQKT
jgi:hypothetical protein